MDGTSRQSRVQVLVIGVHLGLTTDRSGQVSERVRGLVIQCGDEESKEVRRKWYEQESPVE